MSDFGAESTSIYCSDNGCKASFATERRLSNHLKSIHAKFIKSWVDDDPIISLVRLDATDEISEFCENCGEFVSNIEDHLERCLDLGLDFDFEIRDENFDFDFVESSIIEPGLLFTELEQNLGEITKLCEYCGVQINSDSFETHAEECVGRMTRQYICSEENCKASFKTQAHLYNHLRKAHSSVVQCPHRNCVALVRSGSLYSHIKKVHQKVTRKCENCGEKIALFSFQSHFESCINNGEKKFHCTEENCKSSFTTKVDLYSHKYRIHRARIKCPHDNCSSYMKPFLLTRHIRQVHEKFKEPCPSCEKFFMYGTLNRHLKRCTSDGTRSFSCSFADCKSAFKTKVDLQAHVRNVHSERIRCPHKSCNLYIKSAGLKKHFKSIHNEIYSRREK